MTSNWKSLLGYRFPAEGKYMYLVVFEYDKGNWEQFRGSNGGSQSIIAADGTTFITNIHLYSLLIVN